MGSNSQAILVTTSWCGLALLAGGDRYKVPTERAANFVSEYLFEDPVPSKFPPQWDQSNWRVAIGGLFLAEYYASLKKKNPQIKSAKLQKVLARLVTESIQRMESSGGWGHTSRIKNPLGYLELEIVSNWMLAALGACQRLGIAMPVDKVDLALQFIEDCCRPGEGGVGYSPRPGQKGFACPGRTGGALFAFALLGRHEHPLYPRLISSWKKTMSESGEAHGSIAMGMLGSALGARQIGPEEWQEFIARFLPSILDHANPDGSFKHLTGKTPRSAGADQEVGATYNTGIYTLILQLDRKKLSFLGQRLN